MLLLIRSNHIYYQPWPCLQDRHQNTLSSPWWWPDTGTVSFGAGFTLILWCVSDLSGMDWTGLVYLACCVSLRVRAGNRKLQPRFDFMDMMTYLGVIMKHRGAAKQPVIRYLGIISLLFEQHKMTHGVSLPRIRRSMRHLKPESTRKESSARLSFLGGFLNSLHPSRYAPAPIFRLIEFQIGRPLVMSELFLRICWGS